MHIANELSIPLLYISTAGIFDGKKQVYDESDKPNPIGHYAKSKYLGEQYVIDNSKDYLICRAGWMMGGGPKKDKKFINKIMKQINSGKKELHIVNDKLGTPTYTFDFAENTKLLIEKNQRGLFNMVCGGLTSRLGVATELVKLLNLENEIKIIEVGSKYFAEKYFADRPDCERLVNKRLDELHASILNIKLVYLNKFNNKRILIAKKFLKFIKSKKLILPKTNSLKKHVFHLFVLRIKNNQRNQFLNYLKRNNIFAGIHYPLPNHQQKPFLKYNKKKLPITEKISNEIVSIPNYPLLNKKEINKIIRVINNF